VYIKILFELVLGQPVWYIDKKYIHARKNYKQLAEKAYIGRPIATLAISDWVTGTNSHFVNWDLYMHKQLLQQLPTLASTTYFLGVYLLHKICLLQNKRTQ